MMDEQKIMPKGKINVCQLCNVTQLFKKIFATIDESE